MNREAGLQDPCRDLGLDVEAHTAQRDRLEHVTAEDLVGGLHVGQPRGKQDVGAPREQPVGPPRLRRNPRAGPLEPRAVDHRRLAGQDGRDEARAFGRVELEIGVLNHHDVAGGVFETEADSRAFAQIDDRQVREPLVGSPAHALGDDRGAPVGRPVVDDDDFLIDPAKIDLVHPVEHLLDGLRFVVDGNDNRELVGHQVRSNAAARLYADPF